MSRTKRITTGIFMLIVAPVFFALAIALQAWNVYFFGNAIREGYGGIGSGLACVAVLAFGLWLTWKLVQMIKFGWLMLTKPDYFEPGLIDG